MSEDDDLLEDLGALERDYDEAFPHAWEDVIRGTRTPEEVAALRREAGDQPEEIEELARILRPLGEAERDAWVERLVAGAAAPPTDPPAAEPPPLPDATVASLDARRHARITWATATMSLLAAAALVVWLSPRGGPTPPDGTSPPPPFGLVVRNDTAHDVRSTPRVGEVARYRSDTTIHWVLRPERSVAPPLVVRVLVQSRDSSERRLVEPHGASVSDRGVIELRGTLESVLALPAGRWSLRFVIGASAPADVEALDRGGPFSVVEPPYLVDVVP